MQGNQSSQNFFDTLAPSRDAWIKKSSYYYKELNRLHRWLIPSGSTVLSIGCGTGQTLAALEPPRALGIDASYEMVKIAKARYPQFNFQLMDAHHLETETYFDAVLLSNLIGYTSDIWTVLRELRKVSSPESRIVVTNYNFLWQPIFELAEKLQMKMPDRIQNWLPQHFIEHFFALNGFEVIKKGKYLHFPISIPILGRLLNDILANIPFVNSLGLIEYCVARPTFHSEVAPKEVSVSIIIPTHEEAGNVEAIVSLMPMVGPQTEVLFVDLPGKDGTAEKIMQQIASYSGPLTIRYIKQGEKTGKVGALRQGVAAAVGEIVIIYDADLTVPPEDLKKFYLALIEGKADFVNGSRMVYPTEKGAMRFLNQMGNSLFAQLFTWGLGQHFTDTLCGTKAFWKRDFLDFEKRKIPTDASDSFGDFYLLLSAYRKNLKIAEVPVRYKTRRYGDTKLHRFRNGFRFLSIFLKFFWHYRVCRKVVY